MAENTKIQWCHHTFNPWIGCTKVSEGCKHCYAETLMDHRYHRVKWGPSGSRQRTKTWRDPVRWNREAEQLGDRRKVFCASLADVFEDRAELAPWRADLFELIDRCTSLDWLLLTKRPENIGRMWPDSLPRMRENVWLGTSIANQANADECIERLVASRHLADKLFLSIEPQIGFVDISPWLDPASCLDSKIDWVIVGGESQQGSEPARRFDVRWALDMLYDCGQAGVPCFVKQLGSNAWDGHRRLFLTDSHGGDMREWPEALRVRQCPESFIRT